MTLKDIERCFNRALILSFSKKKIFLVFPVLILCSILIVFFRALAINASSWLVMSLIFLPIFLTTGVLLSLGVLLGRIYYHEVKSIKFHYRDILKKSFDVILATSYLSIPPILIYLLLWVVFGIFVLLKEIPGFGQFVGVILTFAPFLIILASIVLCLINLSLLFFVSPAIALKEKGDFTLAKDILESMKKNIFGYFILLVIAVLPIFLVVGILSLSAILTNFSYSSYAHGLTVVMEWFFISLPFALCLTPAVIFFFNFSMESYNYLRKKDE